MNNETVLKVYKRAKLVCEVCGRPFYDPKSQKQLAHRIKAKYRKKYGEHIIDHPINLKAVCCLTPCNSSVDLGVKVAEINELLEEIYNALLIPESEQVYEKIEKSNFFSGVVKKTLTLN